MNFPEKTLEKQGQEPTKRQIRDRVFCCLIFVAVVNTITKCSSERKELIWLTGLDHSLEVRGAKAETQGQEPGGKNWCRGRRVLFTSLLSMACSACCLIYPRTPAQAYS